MLNRLFFGRAPQRQFLKSDEKDRIKEGVKINRSILPKDTVYAILEFESDAVAGEKGARHKGYQVIVSVPVR